MAVTQRLLASELGLSVACVSMALADNPTISEETRRRVQEHAKACGYRPDPLVSEGMSRISRGSGYRETLHVIADIPLRQHLSLTVLWESLNHRAEHLGYRLEYRCLDMTNRDEIGRWEKVARNRGVRGVLIYPLSHAYNSIDLPWDRHVWVAIGDSLRYPSLHRSGRDYMRDALTALAYLQQRGCRRIGFSNFGDHEARVGYPLVQAAALQNHLHDGVLRHPFKTITSSDQSEVLVWLKKERVDGLVLGFDGDYISRELKTWLDAHSHVFLASPHPMPEGPAFWPNYEMMGHEAINLMHRMLCSNGFGIPEFKQTVLSTSAWKGDVTHAVV